MIRMIDIGWAAGFLEGEGWFGGAKYGTLKMGAAQKIREPLDKLQAMFGGVITIRRTRGFSDAPIFWWSLRVRETAAAMMTLYTLMSDKRKREIAEALTRWKNGRHLKAANYGKCIRGHDLTGANAYFLNEKLRRCRECSRQLKHDHRIRLRESSQPELLLKV